MTYTITITSQGQMSIPAAIRRKYALDTIRKVILTETPDGITLRPITDISSLRGALKPTKRLTNLQENRLRAESWKSGTV